MDFAIPDDIRIYLAALDDFIEKEIVPLQMQDDNNRFFDHRREHARTDWDNNGLPRPDGKITARNAPPRRCGRTFALWPAQRVWRGGWVKFGDGGHSRAFGA